MKHGGIIGVVLVAIGAVAMFIGWCMAYGAFMGPDSTFEKFAIGNSSSTEVWRWIGDAGVLSCLVGTVFLCTRRLD